MATKRAQVIFDMIRETVTVNQEQLTFLAEYKNHWEKWFQVELATTLKRRNARDITIENSACRFDSRKKNTPSRVQNDFKTAQIDLVFRRKLESKGKFIGIELKQTQSLQGIKSMLADVVKISAIRRSDWPFRELYFVLFYYEDDCVRRKYGELLNDLRNNETILTETMSFPGIDKLQCLVVYWESGASLEKMNIDSFKKWYSEIEGLMKKYELTKLAKGKTKGGN